MGMDICVYVCLKLTTVWHIVEINKCYISPPTLDLLTEQNNVIPKLACMHSLVKGSGGQRKVLCPKTVMCSCSKTTHFHFSVDLGEACF